MDLPQLHVGVLSSLPSQLSLTGGVVTLWQPNEQNHWASAKGARPFRHILRRFMSEQLLWRNEFEVVAEGTDGADQRFRTFRECDRLPGCEVERPRLLRVNLG